MRPVMGKTYKLNKVEAMKLLQIGPYPPPLGGWSFHIKMFEQYLNAADIENKVLNIGPTRKVLSSEYVDVQDTFDFTRKVFKFQKKGYLLYIHLNGDSVKGFLLTLISQFIALLFFKRTVLSFHAGTVQVCFFSNFNIQKISAALVFFLAKGIMCNSEDVKDKIADFYVDRNKIYAIPCFSKQYLQHKSFLTSEEEKFIEEHDPIISGYLFFRDEYEPETIIHSIKKVTTKFPNLGCILIGSTTGSEPYQELIRKLGVADNFLLVGDKTHDNFLTLFERSHVTVRAHMRDGICSSVMESLALGVPVVACDNGTRPAEVILFESMNPDDMAQKIIFTLSNIGEVKKKLTHLTERDAMQEELNFLLSLGEK